MDLRKDSLKMLGNVGGRERSKHHADHVQFLMMLGEEAFKRGGLSLDFSRLEMGGSPTD